MSENGFFRYAGKLESLPCLVEDFVYDNINLESGNQMVSAGLNNLFGEVTWFYPTSSSSVVNKMVTYNYFDSSPQRPVWTNGTLARTMWEDSAVFGSPHALEYSAGVDTSFDVVGNTEGSTIYYEHETGTDQVNSGGAVTAVTVTNYTFPGDYGSYGDGPGLFDGDFTEIAASASVGGIDLLAGYFTDAEALYIEAGFSLGPVGVAVGYGSDNDGAFYAG